ncbi:MAG: D-tyrosyl-tRNA(Tyr) deacylase [Candidatus Atribacteria bacterium]|nr:D-tyrosyl-tRNA(Tyr) deacylase [Candidatus Atribacteria bacterium]
MRAVIQRVSRASVRVDGKIIGAIDEGLLVFLGVGKEDGEKDVDFMVRKIPNLRIFEDENGKMNRNLKEVGGKVLFISQFTLYGDCRRGLRPSFDEAAPPAEARRWCEKVVEGLEKEGITVEQGEFGAFMEVDLLNQGPVTILLDSKERRRQ